MGLPAKNNELKLLAIRATPESREMFNRLVGRLIEQTGQRITPSRAFELLMTPGNGVAEELIAVLNGTYR